MACSPHQIVPRMKVMDDVEGGLETKGLPVKLPPGGNDESRIGWGGQVKEEAQ